MDRRRTGRLKCELVTCDLGQVVDMSASGMRVRTKEAEIEVGDRRALTLNLEDGVFELEASIVWARDIGRSKKEIGLRFEDLTPEQKTKLFLVCNSMSHAEVGGPSGC